MILTKRDFLRALIAVGAVAAAPAWAQSGAGLDLSGGRAIGDAYRAARPGRADALRRLIPTGVDRAALARLRGRVAADFATGRVFVYQGWRLAETEAQLFALLAGSP